MKSFMSKLMLGAALVAGIAGAATKDNGDHSDAAVANRIAHEIRMYPRYTIWDNINVRVNDGNVELMGQVSQPYKRADMTRLAQSVPGVRSVTNELAVLPLSQFDDQLRLQ